MFDKDLIKLIGPNKKYVVYTVLFMMLGMLANIGITASICLALYYVMENRPVAMLVYPAVAAVVAILIRYVAARRTGTLKDVLGRSVKKDLRDRTYRKILKLGVKAPTI